MIRLELILSLISLVNGAIFRVPTPFVVKSSSYSHEASRFHQILPSVRGGSDSGYDEDEVEWEQDQYDNEDNITIGLEGRGEDSELDEGDGPLLEAEGISDEEFVQMEEGQRFNAANETEVFVDADEKTVDVDSGADESEDFEDALEDQIEEDDEPAPTAQVLEERMAATDDENSSAFVDRMDFADAYDEGESTAGELAAANAAATVVGGSEEEQDVATTPETPSASEITDEMKDILVNDLNYKAREVDVMRPDIAAMILSNNLRRPTEGLPPNFLIEGASVAPGRRRKLVKVSLAVAASAALVFVGLKGDDLEMDGFQKVTEVFAGLIAAVLPKGSKSVESAVQEAVDAEPQADPSSEDTETEAEEIDEDESDHPQSVKPFVDHAPSYEEDLDRTWLDKIITKIENGVKAFMRIKI